MDRAATQTLLGDDFEFPSDNVTSQIICPICGFSGPTELTLEQAEFRWEQLPRTTPAPAAHLFDYYLQREFEEEDYEEDEEWDDEEWT